MLRPALIFGGPSQVISAVEGGGGVESLAPKSFLLRFQILLDSCLVISLNPTEAVKPTCKALKLDVRGAICRQSIVLDIRGVSGRMLPRVFGGFGGRLDLVEGLLCFGIVAILILQWVW